MCYKLFLYTFEKIIKNTMRTQNNFINHVTKQINDLTDVIIEELYEDESDILPDAVDDLTEILKQLKQDYER